MLITVAKSLPDLSDIDCDQLWVGLFEGEEVKGPLSFFDSLLDQALSWMIGEKEISGQYKHVSVVHTLGKCKAKKLVFVGLGKREQLTYVRARAAVAKGVKALAFQGENKRAAFLVNENGALGVNRMTQAVTEAFYLASYTYEGYRQKAKQKKAFERVELYADVNDLHEAEEGLKLALAMAAGTNLARDLVNTPGNYLTPTALKDAIVEVAKRHDNMSCEVLEKEKLESLGMGGILSVNKGSVEPPYMVVVTYQGRETWDDVIGLIGKGVTFDTGGISIKPVAGMEDMKSDMGGAAAVIGALETIGRLQPAVNVMLVVGCVENMPSGSAYKPGDVITTMSGKTVEIITTDAEGRLVLADCLTYAQQQGVSKMVDCATLTGGIVVALGTITTGAMGNNQKMVTDILECAETVGERLWQLPLFEEYRELNKSRFADLKNSGGRHGHAIIGGTFLREFVGDTPWVHLDNAGTAYLTTATDLGPSGATGSMARTIAKFVMKHNH